MEGGAPSAFKESLVIVVIPRTRHVGAIVIPLIGVVVTVVVSLTPVGVRIAHIVVTIVGIPWIVISVPVIVGTIVGAATVIILPTAAVGRITITKTVAVTSTIIRADARVVITSTIAIVGVTNLFSTVGCRSICPHGNKRAERQEAGGDEQRNFHRRSTLTFLWRWSSAVNGQNVKIGLQ